MVWQLSMVTTRSRLPNTPEGHVEDESTTEQPNLVAITERPPVANVLGGGSEHIPRTNIATNNSVVEEDRDASHRQPETMAENVVMGSGGGPAVVEFSGSANLVACMYWLKEVEMAFESSECDVSQRVKFSSQLLRGEALIWWNLTRSALTPEVLAKLT
ncbi:hypothetical protein L6452_37542 [Arctium lappa]|uniref:Uncharacterized protein n=1 Tax=Arctium lappa TaxID=4217 RepID=A0ACB8Y3Y1_ARCLA|nr:hypothetical protein L6452_37542 [Arctium lappa]